jgi:hypothetical protein
MNRISRPTFTEQKMIDALNGYHLVQRHRTDKPSWLSIVLLWSARLCWLATMACVVMGVLTALGVVDVHAW